MIDSSEHHSGKWLRAKTIKRDVGNTPESKTLYRFYWGRYDDVLRLAEPVLEIGISYPDPKLLGECGLCIYLKLENKYDIMKQDGTW